MKPQEYVRLAIRSESMKDHTMMTPGMLRLIHAAFGLQTESAEFTDILKKAIFYGAEIDRTNVLEEMGDILWYMAIIIVYYNTSFEQVMEANIAKLQKRYPHQFDEVMAKVRNLDSEREILEACLQFKVDIDLQEEEEEVHL